MKDEKGAVLFLVIIYSFIMSMIGMAVLYLNAGEELQGKAELNRTRAYFCAEAGLERAQAWVEAFGGFPSIDKDSIESPDTPMEPYRNQYVDKNDNLDPDGIGIRLGGEGLQQGYYKFCVIPEETNNDEKSYIKEYTLVSTGVCGGYVKRLERRRMRVESRVNFTYASLRDVTDTEQNVYWATQDFDNTDDDEGAYRVSLDSSWTVPRRTSFADDSFWTAQQVKNLIGNRFSSSRQDGTINILYGSGTSENMRLTEDKSVVRTRFIDHFRNFVQNTARTAERYFDRPITIGFDGTNIHILNDDLTVNHTLELDKAGQTEIFCEGDIMIAAATFDPERIADPFAANVTLVSAGTIIIRTDVKVQRFGADPEDIKQPVQYALGLVGSSVRIGAGVQDVRLDCAIAAIGQEGSFSANDFNEPLMSLTKNPVIRLNGCIYTTRRGAVGQLQQSVVKKNIELITGYKKNYKYNSVLTHKLPPHFVGYDVFRGYWSDTFETERFGQES